MWLVCDRKTATQDTYYHFSQNYEFNASDYFEGQWFVGLYYQFFVKGRRSYSLPLLWKELHKIIELELKIWLFGLRIQIIPDNRVYVGIYTLFIGTAEPSKQ